MQTDMVESTNCSAELRRAIAGLVAQRQYVHYEQDLGWAQAMSADTRHRIAISTENGNLVAYSVVRQIDRDWPIGTIGFIDRGPVVSDDKYYAKHLTDIVKAYERRGLRLHVSPYDFDRKAITVKKQLLRAGFNENTRSQRLYRATQLIDLKNDIECVWANFRSSFKRQIRKGQKMGLVVEESNFDDKKLHRVFAVFHERRRLAFPGFDCWKQLGPVYSSTNRAFLKVARVNDKLLSGVLSLAFGRGAVFSFSFTTPFSKEQSIPATHELHWEAVKWANAIGCDYYDLGGFWLERGSADSINFFKAQMGGTLVESTGDWVFDRSGVPMRFLDIARRFAKK